MLIERLWQSSVSIAETACNVCLFDEVLKRQPWLMSLVKVLTR
jgi:hypothetical protein